MRSEFFIVLLALLCLGAIAQESSGYVDEPSAYLETAEDSLAEYSADDVNDETAPSSDDENDEDEDEEEDADESHDKTILGYIKVRKGAPRKEWINKSTKVFPLSETKKENGKSSAQIQSEIRAAKAAAKAALAKKKELDAKRKFLKAKAAAKKNPIKSKETIVYKYRKFPFGKLLAPLKYLARRVSRHNRRAFKRWQRLRRVLLGKRDCSRRRGGKCSPGRRFSRAKANAIKRLLGVRSRRGRRLSRRGRRFGRKRGGRKTRARRVPAALKKKLIALRQKLNKVVKKEKKVAAAPADYCGAGSVYFCRRGRCACAKKADAKCLGNAQLICNPAKNVGTMCRCASSSAVASGAEKVNWKTCNVRNASCRAARNAQQNKHYKAWAARRKFINKSYNKMYRRYVELLARYFQKKYRIVVREYVRKYKSNVDLKAKLKELLTKHKAAMLHHAKLHHAAFMKFSKLLAAYKALDVKYNKLVDKYRIDMANALDRLAQTNKELKDEREKVRQLISTKGDLESKIAFLGSEVNRHQALHEASAAENKQLTARHQALIKEFEAHKKEAEAAIKGHQDHIKALQGENTKAREDAVTAQKKLEDAQRDGAEAAKKATDALAQMQTKYEALQKQFKDADAHDKAALEALTKEDRELKGEVAKLTTRLASAKKANGGKLLKDHKRFLKLLKKAAAIKVKQDRRIKTLRRALIKAKRALRRAVKRLARRKASGRKAKSNRKTVRSLKKKLDSDVSSARKRISHLRRQLKHSRARAADLARATEKYKQELKSVQDKLRATQGDYDKLLGQYKTLQSDDRKKSALLEKKRAAKARRSSKKGNNGSKRRNATSSKKSKKVDPNAQGIHAANVSAACGNLYAKAREANEQLFAHKYNHYDFYKVKVEGAMTNENILNACESRGLQTPCDHPAYSDGNCVVVTKRALHFSYNPHHDFPKWLIRRTFWYTTNGQLTLFNTGTTHRWSNANDANGSTMCVLPAACKSTEIKWNHFRFYRVRVPGQMTNEAIYEACKNHGLETPCDHPAYHDGKCVSVQKAALHMSYNPHHNFPKDAIDRSYWYAGSHRFPLQNFRGTHRWATQGDRDGVTFCVAPLAARNPLKIRAQWHGYDWYVARVDGQITASSINAACSKYGYETPCDHPAYADGNCVAVTKRALHLSYAPHHSLDRKLINRKYFYTGPHHTGALQSWRGTHRWAAAGDRHGDTLCVKRSVKPDPTAIVATWEGYQWFKVQVPGQITNEAIEQACAKAGYQVPCDNAAYSNGKCVSVIKQGHLSYNPHHNFPSSAIDRVYFYAGNNRYPLQNWRGTHRWAALGDVNSNTFCVKRVSADDDSNAAAKWHGWEWFKVRVPGKVSAQAIADACKAKKLRTPCDHPSWADGKCVAVQKSATHLSYNPHHNFPRNVIDGAYFYAGPHHTGAIQNWKGTHRWATASDHDVDTLCVKRIPIGDDAGHKFNVNGFKVYKFRVHGRVTAANIRKTCAKKDMMTPCDHPHYADGHCIALFKSPLHLSYNPHHNLDRSVMDRTYVYTGSAHTGALQNWRNTHRWAALGDYSGNTLCVTPIVTDSKAVVAEWKGNKFHKVLVEGPMTNQNIKNACTRLGYKTPCDHASYNDGECVVLGAHHMSYNGHHNFPRSVINRTYWYTGAQAFPLQNWRNTHRWARVGDAWENTLCIE